MERLSETTNSNKELTNSLFHQLYRKNAPLIDTNHDGKLSENEVDAAVHNPAFKGMDAVFVGALRFHFEDLADLDKKDNPYVFDKNHNKLVDKLELGQAIGSGRFFGEDLNRLKAMYESGYTWKSPALKGFSPKQTIDSATILRTDECLSEFDLKRVNDAAKLVSSQVFKDPQRHLDWIKWQFVHQRSIGDCGWQEALASMAKFRPKWLDESIKIDSNGDSIVRFRAHPEQAIRVHRLTEAEQICDSGASEGGNWPGVFEKAYGKSKLDADCVQGERIESPQVERNLHSCYTRIALQILTGLHYNEYDVESRSLAELDSLFTRTVRRSLPMTAVIGELGPRSRLKPAQLEGLSDKHAYAVVGYNHSKQLLKLYDANSYYEPKTKDGKPKDGHADGVFEMSLKEFKSKFDGAVLPLDD